MICSFRGIDKTVELYEDKIVIVYRVLSKHWRQTKEIQLSSISAIQVKKPGLSGGYIQFIFSGSQESKSAHPSIDDENTIMYTGAFGKGISGAKAQYEQAITFKNEVQKLIAKNQSPTIIMQNSSISDELFKLKSLLDSGIISKEEFILAKNKLLK